MLEQRIVRLGTGYTHYWYMSAACSLVRTVIFPNVSAGQKEQAIDRVARQYYHVLQSQEDFVKAKEIIFPVLTNKVSKKTRISRDPFNHRLGEYISRSVTGFKRYN